MGRPKIPKTTEADILTESRRRCCICFGANGDLKTKKGQIAHLDHNPNNNALANLAWLCLNHHDEYDSRTSQSKNYTIKEVQHYRKKLFAHFKKIQPEISRDRSYRGRDLKQLRRVMETINTNVIDAFLHHIRLGRIPINIFHFWEDYNAILSSSLYHIHDPALNKLLKQFHMSWAKCLSHGEWFTQTSSFQILRLLSRHEVHPTKHEQLMATETRIEDDASRMEKSYDKILQHIRKFYMEIDLTSTNKVAWDGYQESVGTP